MTAKKKRASPDPAPKKKTPAAKGPSRSTSEAVSPPAAAKAAKAAPSKSSALDAAARVLRENGQPMSCPELIEQMAAKGYWSSPKGKTPASTLYAALMREVQVKDASSKPAPVASPIARGRSRPHDGPPALCGGPSPPTQASRSP